MPHVPRDTPAPPPADAPRPRRFGIDRISIRGWAVDPAEVAARLFGKEVQRDERTGELVFARPESPAAGAAPPRPGPGRLGQ